MSESLYVDADAHATGVEKLVGDFWATGMDEAKIDAQGIDPLKPELAAIDGVPSATLAERIRRLEKRLAELADED
mgnify:CR=1 FL=1